MGGDGEGTVQSCVVVMGWAWGSSEVSGGCGGGVMGCCVVLQWRRGVGWCMVVEVCYVVVVVVVLML